MSSKKTLLLSVVAFICLIASASFMYNRLRSESSSGLAASPAPVTESNPNPNTEPDIELSSTDENGYGNENGDENGDEIENGYGNDDEGENEINADRPLATDIVMFDQNQEQVNLSDYFGKPIVLNFWASWCPPCVIEMPYFDNVYLEMREDVHFVMLNLTDGQRETIEIAEQFVEREGYSFPIYFDLEQSGVRAYRISGIPTTYFIDSNGRVSDFVIGAIDEAALRNFISQIE